MPFNLSVSIATCVLILGLGFNSIDPVSVQGQEQTPTYLDPDGRFSIKYPVDAEVRTGESDVIAVSFEARDSTPTSTSVIILNNTDTKDLDVIVEDVISSTNSTGNFTFISPTCAKWTLSGYEACGIAYNAAPSATPGSSQLGPNGERIRQVISNVGDKVYIIELRTDSSHVNTHKDVFNAMVHSFQVPGDSGQLTPKIGTSSSGEIRLTTSTGPITYTDPSGFYTLQHPSGWEIEYEEPVTRFDEPTTTITVKPGLGSIVIISVLHNQDNIDEDIGDLALSLFSRNYERDNPGVSVDASDSDTYQIDGNKAYAILSSGTYRAFTNDFLSPISDMDVKSLVLLSYFEDSALRIQFIAPALSFDTDIQDVDTMIDSIKILNQKQDTESGINDEESEDEDVDSE